MVKLLAECRRCMLSTWGFLVEESRNLWTDSRKCIPSFLFVCLLSFLPFPHPPLRNPGIAENPSSCSPHSLHSPALSLITFTFYLLCQRGHCCRYLGSAASSEVQSTHFWIHIWMYLWCPGVLCRSNFVQLWMSNQLSIEGRRKRNDPQGHDTDVTQF